MGYFWPKYIIFELKEALKEELKDYREVRCHDNEWRSNI